MAANYELVIGDKNTSSWSLRPWLLMKAFHIPFSEVNISLRSPDSRANILRHSSSGLVPALKADGMVIWDTLAIAEFLAEEHADKPIWPVDRKARAHARSISAEMHSGFAKLREECPMDFLNVPGWKEVSEATKGNISRIVEIWKACRAAYAHQGDFLFGQFSAADAMYAPVGSRFHSYGVPLAEFGDNGSAARYRDTIMNIPEMLLWADEAGAEIAKDKM